MPTFILLLTHIPQNMSKTFHRHSFLNRAQPYLATSTAPFFRVSRLASLSNSRSIWWASVVQTIPGFSWTVLTGHIRRQSPHGSHFVASPLHPASLLGIDIIPTKTSYSFLLFVESLGFHLSSMINPVFGILLILLNLINLTQSRFQGPTSAALGANIRVIVNEHVYV